jgi:hypothetical protein
MIILSLEIISEGIIEFWILAQWYRVTSLAMLRTPQREERATRDVTFGPLTESANPGHSHDVKPANQSEESLRITIDVSLQCQ